LEKYCEVSVVNRHNYIRKRVFIEWNRGRKRSLQNIEYTKATQQGIEAAAK
jgi:hypothetical protein